MVMILTKVLMILGKVLKILANVLIILAKDGDIICQGVDNTSQSW